MDLLFDREPNASGESAAGRYFYPAFAASLGFLGGIVRNAGNRRPIMSGIQIHFLLTAAGYGLGEWVYWYRKKKAAERDAVLKHYVELHPERFIEPPRHKYKDVLEEWIPVR